MSSSRLCLFVLPVLAIASLPVFARAQVNSREIRLNPTTGAEMRGSEYANRYLEQLRQRHREEQERNEKVWEDMRKREVEHARNVTVEVD